MRVVCVSRCELTNRENKIELPSRRKPVKSNVTAILWDTLPCTREATFSATEENQRSFRQLISRLAQNPEYEWTWQGESLIVQSNVSFAERKKHNCFKWRVIKYWIPNISPKTAIAQLREIHTQTGRKRNYSSDEMCQNCRNIAIYVNGYVNDR